MKDIIRPYSNRTYNIAAKRFIDNVLGSEADYSIINSWREIHTAVMEDVFHALLKTVGKFEQEVAVGKRIKG